MCVTVISYAYIFAFLQVGYLAVLQNFLPPENGIMPVFLRGKSHYHG